MQNYNPNIQIIIPVDGNYKQNEKLQLLNVIC